MKLWLKITAIVFGVLVVGFVAYALVSQRHSGNDQIGGVNTLNMSTDSERQACLNVLSEYAPKHPSDLKCSMHILEGDTNSDVTYYFADPSTGDVLTIDTTLHTSVLTDKNGKVIGSN